MRFRLGSSLIFSGEVELLADNPLAAARELRESCEIFEAMGEKSFFSTAAARLAEALYAQERDEEAERWTKRSEETAASLDLLSQVHYRATRAKIVARQGRLEDAERLAREAVELAESTDSPNLRAGTLMDLAEILRAAGRADEASAALRESLSLYERKGNLVSAARARARLGELAP